MKAAKPARDARVAGWPQPRSPASTKPRASRKRLALKAVRPAQSTRVAWGPSTRGCGHEQQRRGADHEVDPEHAAPAGEADERAAEDGAEGEAGAEGGAEDAERLDAAAAGEGGGEDGGAAGEHAGGADALQAAGDVQDQDVRGQGGDQGHRHEDDGADGEDAAAAELVGEGAGGQHAGREGDAVGVLHPLSAGDVGGEVDGEVGHRHRGGGDGQREKDAGQRDGDHHEDRSLSLPPLRHRREPGVGLDGHESSFLPVAAT
ncbi:hypothetical protein O1L60_00110 [Streptomyces diastatochromogenes]|nr:hypothetical protein [Streptomyces diastatochromogenes]